MGFWRGVGKFAGFFVNVRVDQWFGWETFKNNTDITAQALRNLLSFNNKPIDETSADDRQLTQDLEPLIKQYRLMVGFYLLLSFCVFSYGIYYAIVVSRLMGFLMCLILSIYALSRAFYYHFWKFQLEQKRLGCTFQDWLKFYHLG